jgi:hypothetical protein
MNMISSTITDQQERLDEKIFRFKAESYGILYSKIDDLLKDSLETGKTIEELHFGSRTGNTHSSAKKKGFFSSFGLFAS